MHHRQVGLYIYKDYTDLCDDLSSTVSLILQPRAHCGSDSCYFRHPFTFCSTFHWAMSRLEDKVEGWRTFFARYLPTFLIWWGKKLLTLADPSSRSGLEGRTRHRSDAPRGHFKYVTWWPWYIPWASKKLMWGPWPYHGEKTSRILKSTYWAIDIHGKLSSLQFIQEAMNDNQEHYSISRLRSDPGFGKFVRVTILTARDKLQISARRSYTGAHWCVLPFLHQPTFDKSLKEELLKSATYYRYWIIVITAVNKPCITISSVLIDQDK